jgi:hypothetical protein
MTTEYHQIPIAVDSMTYTAFTCFMGVFEWLRFPIAAGSWFQQAMQIIYGALVSSISVLRDIPRRSAYTRSYASVVSIILKGSF